MNTAAETNAETNMALLRTAYQNLRNRDLDACVELLTENFIANLPGAPGPLHGREIWKQGTQTMLEGFPDLQITVEDMFGAGDKVAVRVHFRGTHQGTFQGVAATHRPVSFRSVELYRLEGDRIAEEWVAPDMITLMRQISPPPGP
ncbi:ester cyclase [Streptomyces katsurahamanus]|uniref:Ester cyclase n=1 Tax=Streptomyces katsurahamanus TaxID=2577098 RepID=A0ABW9NT54_9ACTN|nr:ester cyclase [Streptomyces katsurahamanus]MQS36471.1 ester cyclase [Streptomyces katsurahamanus]